MSDKAVIVGASHAGSQIAVQLRQQGWEGEIVVISDEPHLPYHRPPLSKEYLSGARSLENILIRSQAAYDKAEVQFRLGQKVTGIDRTNKQLMLADGERIDYNRLALATGAKVRKIDLPGVENTGVNYLRTLQDVDQIKTFAKPGKHAVIIGGGYIGLETAAKLRQLGMEVVVLETLPRVLQRVTAPQVSDFYTRIHREEGVSILTGKVAQRISGDDRVKSVICQDGSEYPADLVVIGVGVIPSTELAEQSGLDIDNGILVNEYAQTSDPDIVAAGDCTNHYNAVYDRYIRLESVQNANDQGKVAAATICGKMNAYNTLPWFWSEQYDIRLQIAGLSEGYDQRVIRGDIRRGRKFAVFYLKAEHLLAVDAVNSMQEFMQSKRLIVEKVAVDPEKLADEQFALKDFLH